MYHTTLQTIQLFCMLSGYYSWTMYDQGVKAFVIDSIPIIVSSYRNRFMAVQLKELDLSTNKGSISHVREMIVTLGSVLCHDTYTTMRRREYLVVCTTMPITSCKGDIATSSACKCTVPPWMSCKRIATTLVYWANRPMNAVTTQDYIFHAQSASLVQVRLLQANEKSLPQLTLTVVIAAASRHFTVGRDSFRITASRPRTTNWEFTPDCQLVNKPAQIWLIKGMPLAVANEVDSYSTRYSDPSP